MPKPPPPEHVREARLALSSASAFARAARKKWTGLRDIYKAGLMPRADDIARLTRAMWAAELRQEAAAARWREVLAERESMLVAIRWDLAELERWAAAQQSKNGAP
jgi:hypothetical protein